MPLFVRSTTRQVLQALRHSGLTVNYGGVSPGVSAETHPELEVVDALMLKPRAYSKLGYGCWNHPDREGVEAEVVRRTADALYAAGFEFRVTKTGQVVVTGQRFVRP